MNIYEKYVLPKFLNCACGSTPIEYQRKKIVPKAKGLILEIGIGSGLNLPFYDKSKVEKFWGLDPSEELSLMAKEKSEELGLKINFLSCGAENIPLPDDHIDNAVVTYTMCTIPEVLAANKEIIRILKPNGKLLFCEHGLSPDKKISKWQSRINPIWGKIAGGCHLNRDIPKILNDSGFDIIEMEEMYLPNTPKFAGYNYWGTAVINY